MTNSASKQMGKSPALKPRPLSSSISPRKDSRGGVASPRKGILSTGSGRSSRGETRNGAEKENSNGGKNGERNGSRSAAPAAAAAASKASDRPLNRGSAFAGGNGKTQQQTNENRRNCVNEDRDGHRENGRKQTENRLVGEEGRCGASEGGCILQEMNGSAYVQPFQESQVVESQESGIGINAGISSGGRFIAEQADVARVDPQRQLSQLAGESGMVLSGKPEVIAAGRCVGEVEETVAEVARAVAGDGVGDVTEIPATPPASHRLPNLTPLIVYEDSPSLAFSISPSPSLSPSPSSSPILPHLSVAPPVPPAPPTPLDTSAPNPNEHSQLKEASLVVLNPMNWVASPTPQADCALDGLQPPQLPAENPQPVAAASRADVPADANAVSCEASQVPPPVSQQVPHQVTSNPGCDPHGSAVSAADSAASASANPTASSAANSLVNPAANPPRPRLVRSSSSDSFHPPASLGDAPHNATRRFPHHAATPGTPTAPSAAAGRLSPRLGFKFFSRGHANASPLRFRGRNTGGGGGGGRGGGDANSAVVGGDKSGIGTSMKCDLREGSGVDSRWDGWEGVTQGQSPSPLSPSFEAHQKQSQGRSSSPWSRGLSRVRGLVSPRRGRKHDDAGGAGGAGGTAGGAGGAVGADGGGGGGGAECVVEQMEKKRTAAATVPSAFSASPAPASALPEPHRRGLGSPRLRAWLGSPEVPTLPLRRGLGVRWHRTSSASVVTPTTGTMPVTITTSQVNTHNPSADVSTSSNAGPYTNMTMPNFSNPAISSSSTSAFSSAGSRARAAASSDAESARHVRPLGGTALLSTDEQLHLSASSATGKPAAAAAAAAGKSVAASSAASASAASSSLAAAAAAAIAEYNSLVEQSLAAAPDKTPEETPEETPRELRAPVPACTTHDGATGLIRPHVPLPLKVLSRTVSDPGGGNPAVTEQGGKTAVAAGGEGEGGALNGEGMQGGNNGGSGGNTSGGGGGGSGAGGGSAAAGARLEHHARCCIISYVAASTGARPPLAISDDLALLQRLAHDATAYDCNDGRTCGELQHLWRKAAPVTHLASVTHDFLLPVEVAYGSSRNWYTSTWQLLLHLSAAPAPGGCSCTWRLLTSGGRISSLCRPASRADQQLQLQRRAAAAALPGAHQHISSTTRRSAAASAYCSSDTLAEVAAGELETTSSNGLLTHSSAESQSCLLSLVMLSPCHTSGRTGAAAGDWPWRLQHFLPTGSITWPLAATSGLLQQMAAEALCTSTLPAAPLDALNQKLCGLQQLL
ncbi:unnamed protein product [Closterium sp. NIES-54]